MPSSTNKTLGYQNASLWRQSLYNATDACPVYYIYIGNHVPYANEASPDSIVDTIESQKEVWDNMFAAKKVTANEIEMVVPRVNWTSNTNYRSYDDTILVSDLISENTAQNLKAMYVFTSDRNVYKCLSNNASANSTVEPTGDYSTSNGVISTADGYLWKYMYNVKPSNRFVNSDWIPAPQNTNALDYDVSPIGVVDGEVASIIVTDGGSGYYHNNVSVSSYLSGCSVLTLANTTNVSANMTVSGLGILTGTHINTIDTPNNRITLSSATSANGGGTGNTLAISTRIYIEGDGIGGEASATVSGGNVSKITVSTIGTGYSFANAQIYGSGTSANARVIIAPKFGHAHDPAKELVCDSAMISVKIGEIDATEGGIISSNTSFRQYGLMSTPYKYGEDSALLLSAANTIVSQTFDITLVSGSTYELDEFVYQGSANNASVYGYVHSQVANRVSLTKVKGTIQTGLSLVGANSGITRTVVRVDNPEFEPYSGDILYTENITKVDREDGQSEDLKVIVRF